MLLRRVWIWPTPYINLQESVKNIACYKLGELLYKGEHGRDKNVYPDSKRTNYFEVEFDKSYSFSKQIIAYFKLVLAYPMAILLAPEYDASRLC